MQKDNEESNRKGSIKLMFILIINILIDIGVIYSCWNLRKRKQTEQGRSTIPTGVLRQPQRSGDLNVRQKMTRNKKTVLLGVVTAVILIVVLNAFVDRIPPPAFTYSTMHMAKRRTLRYAAKHDELPKSLSQTEAIPGYHSSLRDGWGRDIDYAVSSNGTVTLTSLGKDKQVGGTKENADMIGVFQTRKANGKWEDEFVEWTIDPFAPYRERNKVEQGGGE